jgi:hypothetical protein
MLCGLVCGPKPRIKRVQLRKKKRSTNRLQSQIKSVCSSFHVLSCPHTGRVAREDCSGSVSAQLVAQVSTVEQRPVARFRLRTVGSPGQHGGATACLRTGATSSTASFRGRCLTSAATSNSPLRECIALVQAQDADGPWRRR